MYPNYVYRPQRAKDKDGRSKSRKPKGRTDEPDSEGVSFVLPMSQPRHHGRSASAPTPPPYQAIQIPNVYQLAPSCPTSPSLLPMIARRSSHPDHETAMANFDFIAPAQLPPPFGQFEASLQVCIFALVRNPNRVNDVFFLFKFKLAIRICTKHVQHTQSPARARARAPVLSARPPDHFPRSVDRVRFIRSVLSNRRPFHTDLHPAFAVVLPSPCSVPPSQQ